MVPRAEFSSYYGRPVIKSPVWAAPDIAGYLFLGGLAGASSVLAAGAQLTERPGLAKVAKSGALAAGCLSLAGLVHDLGRPSRFINMLRTFKVTSPMSVGSWLLAGYVPVAAASCASAVTGRLPRIGAAATLGSAVLGPAVATYTAALISDTAVPAWHDGYREMPFLFAGSAATAAGGLGLLAAPASEFAPARNLAVLGACGELAAARLMERRLGLVAEPYQRGPSGGFMKAGQVLAAAGLVGALATLGRPRLGLAGRLAGAAFLAASAVTRWGIFHAGRASAADPKYTVVPQRERVEARESRSG
jgi:DMSO reductase anchor subunit